MRLLGSRTRRAQPRRTRAYVPSLREDHGEALEPRFLSAVVFTKQSGWLLSVLLGNNTPVTSATHAFDNDIHFVDEAYYDPYLNQTLHNTLTAGNIISNLENTASGPNGGSLLSLSVDHASTFDANIVHANYPYPQSGSAASVNNAKWDFTGSNSETSGLVRVQFDLNWTPSAPAPDGTVVTWPSLQFTSNQISLYFNTGTAYGSGLQVFDNTTQDGPTMIDEEFVDWRGGFSYRLDQYFEIGVPMVETVSYLSTLDITMNQVPVGTTFTAEQTQFEWSFSVTAVPF